MKKIFKLFRIITAAAGVLCIFGAAGTDQMYSNMRQMPPDSVGTMITWGFILLIPSILHLIKEKR